jgi:uncharacterized caspase-like protein
MKTLLRLMILFCYTVLYQAYALNPSDPSWQKDVLSFEDAKAAADNGNPYAQAVVSLHYELGWQTVQSVDNAVRYAAESAQAGNPLGMYCYGALLRSGTCGDRRKAEGLEMQIKSLKGLDQMARENNPYAMTSVGVVLFQGELVPQDLDNSALWYKNAADKKYYPAMFNYAMCAYSGKGIKKNTELAYKYILDLVDPTKYKPAMEFVNEHIEEFNSNNDRDRHQWIPLHYKKNKQWIIEFEKENILKFEDEPNTDFDFFASRDNKRWLDFKGNIVDDLSIYKSKIFKNFTKSAYDDIQKNSVVLSDINVEANVTEFVSQILFSPSGKIMATIGSDYRGHGNSNCIKMWDMNTKSCLWSTSVDLKVSEIDAAFFDENENLIIVGIDQTDEYKAKYKFNFYKCDISKKIISQQSGGLRNNNNKFRSLDKNTIIWNGEIEGVRGIYSHDCRSNKDSLLLKDDSSFGDFYVDHDCIAGRYIVVKTKSNLNDDSGGFADVNLFDIKYIDTKTNFELITSSSSAYKIVENLNKVIVGGGDGGVNLVDLQSLKITNLYRPKSNKLFLGKIANINLNTKNGSWIAINSNGKFIKGNINSTFEESKDIEVFSINRAELSPAEKGAEKYQMPIPKGLAEGLNYSGESTEPEMKKPFFDDEESESIKTYLLSNGDWLFTDGKELQFRWDHALKKCVRVEDGLYIDNDEIFQIGKKPRYVLDCATNTRREIPEDWSFVLSNKSNVLWQNSKYELILSNYGAVYNSVLLTRDFKSSNDLNNNRYGAQENLNVFLNENKICYNAIDGFHVFDVISNTEILKISKEFMKSYKYEYSDKDEGLGDRIFYSNQPNKILSFGSKKFDFSKLDAEDNKLLYENCENLPDIAKFMMPNPKWETFLQFYHDCADGYYFPILLGDDKAEYKQCYFSQITGDVVAHRPLVGLSPKRQIAAIFDAIGGAGNLYLIDTLNKKKLNNIGLYTDNNVNVSDVSHVTYVKPLDEIGERLLICRGNTLISMDYKKGIVLSTENLPSIISVACSSDGKDIVAESENGIKWFYKFSEQGKLVPNFKLGVELNNNWIISTFDGYYMTKGCDNLVAITIPYDGKSDISSNVRVSPTAFPSDQFSLRLNRPDLVLNQLGAPKEAIKIAEELRAKRLKRMGMTEDMLLPNYHLPVISFEGKMPLSTNSDSISFNVILKDTNFKLERLHIYLNNVPINGRDGESLRNLAVQELSSKISVKLASGRNKIQVSVVNDAGAESIYATTEVICTANRPKPALYTVALGVSEYSNPDWNLRYASKDAKDIVACIHDRAGDSYSDVKSLCLTDKEVTKDAIGKIREMLSKATIDDTVVMFVAGHGLLDDNYEYYYGTSDIDFSNPSSRGITFDVFDDLLADLPCLKKSLLMDTCHAGELDAEEKKSLLAINTISSEKSNGEVLSMRPVGARGMAVKGIEGARGRSEWYDRIQRLFVDLRRGSGSTILSSSGGAEYALESSEQKNGLFTYAVLEALKGHIGVDTNNDGLVQMSEMTEYVKKRVAVLSNTKQTPNVRRINLEADFSITYSIISY